MSERRQCIYRKWESTNRKTPRSVSGSSPPPSPVQTEPFVGNYLKETSSPECIRVCLALDLENVKREKNNFSNTNHANSSCFSPQVLYLWKQLRYSNKPSGGGVQDRLSTPLSKGPVKLLTMMGWEVIPHKRLTTILVNSLRHLPHAAWLTFTISTKTKTNLPCTQQHIPIQETTRRTCDQEVLWHIP